MASPSGAALRVDANEIAEVVGTAKNKPARFPSLAARIELRHLIIETRFGPGQIDDETVRRGQSAADVGVGQGKIKRGDVSLPKPPAARPVERRWS